MSEKPGVLGGAFLLLRQGWPGLLRLLLPYMLAYAGLLVLEAVAIARLDWWLPVDTMERANRFAVIVSGVGVWLRLCVVGAAVHRALNAWPPAGGEPVGRRFLFFWVVVALVLAAALLAVDLWRNDLRFREWETTGEHLRTLWLAAIYMQLIAFWMAVRLLAGAARIARDPAPGWTAAWGAVTTLESMWIFLVLMVLKLVVEDVFVQALSYVPLIAPFWFIPNELSEHRYFVGQGTRIAAESLGLLLYAAFWVSVYRRIDTSEPSGVRRE